MVDQPSPRRRFQFRLRTLMIVVTILAVASAYATHEAKVVRERAKWFESHVRFSDRCIWSMVATFPDHPGTPAHEARTPLAANRLQIARRSGNVKRLRRPPLFANSSAHRAWLPRPRASIRSAIA